SLYDPRLADEATRDGRLRLEWPAPSRSIALWLQFRRPPFALKKVRQALSAAVDRDRLVRATLSGRGAVAPPMPAGAIEPDDLARLPFYRRDVDAARRLLAESGPRGGLLFTALVERGRPDAQATAEVVQYQLKEAGIGVAIEPVDRDTLASRWRSGEFQALFASLEWVADPNASLRPYVYSPSDRDHGASPNHDID